MRRIIPCLTLCTMLLALFLSCGDDSTTAPPPENTNVTLESGNAASKSIGVEGGTLTTTANDGTAYTLEIPEGSIPENETITMTPIVGIDGYPLANGVAAGVDLKPAGLVFAVPATLTIETTKTSGAGLVPVAITYEGDAMSFAPDFLGSDVGTFTIPLLHFSGGTVGFATAQELEQLTSGGTVNCLQTAIDSLITGNVPAAVASYRSCFVSDVLPAINQASTDQDLAKAIGQYTMWKADSRFAIGMPPFDDDSEVQQAMQALVPKLQEAIIRDNGQCQQNESFVSAEDVLFWQRQAAHFGLDTVANLLDLDTVVRNLCLRPVVDDVQLPDNMQVGFPHSLDIQFGVIFEGQTASQGGAVLGHDSIRRAERPAPDRLHQRTGPVHNRRLCYALGTALSLGDRVSGVSRLDHTDPDLHHQGDQRRWRPGRLRHDRPLAHGLRELRRVFAVRAVWGRCRRGHRAESERDHGHVDIDRHVRPHEHGGNDKRNTRDYGRGRSRARQLDHLDHVGEQSSVVHGVHPRDRRDRAWRLRISEHARQQHQRRGSSDRRLRGVEHLHHVHGPLQHAELSAGNAELRRRGIDFARA